MSRYSFLNMSGIIVDFLYLTIDLCSFLLSNFSTSVFDIYSFPQSEAGGAEADSG